MNHNKGNNSYWGHNIHNAQRATEKIDCTPTHTHIEYSYAEAINRIKLESCSCCLVIDSYIPPYVVGPDAAA